MSKNKFTFLAISITFAMSFIISCSGKDGLDGKDYETAIPLCNGSSIYNPATQACEIDFSKFTEEETKVLVRMRNPKSRVSVDEAVEQANWVIDFLNTGELGVNRRINSVSALASDDIEFAESLKSIGIEVPDTLIYIVNFEDSLGFAIVSADTRIDGSILAFTGSGSLTDSIDNPGVSIFLEHLEDYMLNSIIEAERQKDSLIGGIMDKLTIETSTKSLVLPSDIFEIKEISTVSSLVFPLVPIEWGQRVPFNDSLKYKNCPQNNGRVLTGCVAVAVAHIMSYWKHPAKIGNYSFDWTELNKYTGNNKPPLYPGAAKTHINNAPIPIRSQVANLMKQIGNGVGMEYGCDLSVASKTSGPNFLLRNGFSLQKTTPSLGSPTAVLASYNSKAAIASMNRREPLFVRGCSKKINHKIFGFTIYTSYGECHAWVIDGYLKQRTVVTIGGLAISGYYDSEYIHNNWGWHGGSNGYFKSGVFNSNQDPDIYISATKSGEDHNFQYEIQMTPYIRR